MGRGEREYNCPVRVGRKGEERRKIERVRCYNDIKILDEIGH